MIKNQKVLILLVAIASSQAYPFEFKEFCGFGQESIGVNLEVKVEYPTEWVKTYPFLKDVRKRVYLNCHKDRGCTGFISEGTYLSTHVLQQLKLNFIGKSVAVITAGASEFTLDKSTETFKWVENLKDGLVATKKCPKGSMFF